MSLKSLISSSVIFTLTMIISVFNVAKAAEQTVATVYNDENSTTYKLVVDAIDGRAMKTFYKDVYEKGKKVRREALNHQVIMNSGMVLEQRDQHVIMKLKSNNFDVEQGGIIVVDTLYNGATGERRGYEIQLAQDKTGWALFQKGKMVKEIFIQTNKVVFIGAVGIKNLVLK